ncbi:MAG: hypothetical protein IKB88_06230 [Clostridia bacterium]|nr:hypothetical protein [Clostridia bacterium]
MSKNPTDKSVVGEIKTEIEFDIDKIPKEAVKDLTGTFLPDIIAFFESEEGRKEFED